MSRPALGRGLDALLPAARQNIPQSAEQDADVRELPPQAIEPNPQQPRTMFDDASAEELTASIREHGMLQPLLVRSLGQDRYQLIAGERRWRAAQAAGLAHVPVLLTDADDGEMLTLALVENLQRADLSPIDRAAAFQYLLDAGLTQFEVAKRIGKSRSAVANSVRLLKLPPDLREHVAAGRLSEGQARALLAAPPQDWQQLADFAILNQLSVRQMEAAARRLQEEREADPESGKPGQASSQKKPSAVRREWGDWCEAAAERLQRAFGTRVSVSHEDATGGRISLRWYSFEQLTELVERLAAVPPTSQNDEPGSADGNTEQIIV